MRKFPVIVALVLIVVGGAYALVANLLPDNSRFPRVPTGDGTIGGAIVRILGITDLANYLGDGTVANTNMLSGTTADKLLKSEDICLAPNVWIKTDATGKPVCGSNGGMLAATIGTAPTITCAVTAYHANGTSETLTSGTGILEGDIIQTAPACSVTITFADLSLIRIDGDSTVSLDSGVTTSGQSIAYAILNNGGLWGRVLTETGGYYIGNSDIVAGVRGTSINVTQGAPGMTPPAPTWSGIINKWIPGNTMMGMTNLNVIHSLFPTTEMNCMSFSGITTFSGMTRFQEHISGTTHMTGGDWICNNMKTQAENPMVTGMIPSVADLYQWNPRIANNTVADLDYMVQLLKSGSISAPKKVRIQNEINVTKPGPAEYDAICPDEAGGTVKKVYWNVFSGTTIGPCQSALAIADYTIGSGSANMYFSGGEAVSPGTLTFLKNAFEEIWDDGYFGWKECNSSHSIGGSRGSHGSPNNILPSGTNHFNEMLDRYYPSWKGQYSGLYLTNYTPIYCTNDYIFGDWDKFKYTGILYGIKNQNFIPPATGINIPTTTPYISYPLPFLTNKIGSLAGKKVTIRVDVADIKRTGSTPYFLLSYSGAAVQGAWLSGGVLKYGLNSGSPISQSISICASGLPASGPVDISLSQTSIQILKTNGTLVCSTSGTANISNPSQFFIGAKNPSSGQWGGNISKIIIDN